MSKRLNKRQQREAEELELLKAEQDRVATEKAAPVEDDEDEEEEEEEEVVEGEAPVNAFAAVCYILLFEPKLTDSSEEMRWQKSMKKKRRRRRKRK